jgi:hypothetical protein
VCTKKHAECFNAGESDGKDHPFDGPRFGRCSQTCVHHDVRACGLKLIGLFFCLPVNPSIGVIGSMLKY